MNLADLPRADRPAAVKPFLNEQVRVLVRDLPDYELVGELIGAATPYLGHSPALVLVVRVGFHPATPIHDAYTDQWVSAHVVADLRYAEESDYDRTYSLCDLVAARRAEHEPEETPS